MDVEKKRLRKLRELGQDRPLVAGSLNRVERRNTQGRTSVYHLLTFKEAGKTRSVYVPKDLVKEVQSWIRNHRRVKQLMSEVSTMSIAQNETTHSPGAGPAHPPLLPVVVGGAGPDERSARRTAVPDAPGPDAGRVDVRLSDSLVARVGRGE